MEERVPPNLVELSVDITVAYLGSHTVAVEDVPGIIASIYQAVNQASSGAAVAAPARQEPAVPIKKSVTPEYIVCLEDGRKYKSIKRHIMSAYGMTPADYRAKWSLPADYPMVAPGYSAMRSALAKELGLGFEREAGGKKAIGRKARQPK